MSDLTTKQVPVLILWEDSWQVTPQWTSADAFEAPSPCYCETLGFVVYEDGDVLCVAQSRADQGEQIAGVMTIPQRSIIAKIPISDGLRALASVSR